MLINPSKEKLAQYMIKQLRVKFEEELDTLVSNFINEGLPLEDISHVLDLQKYAVDESSGLETDALI